MLFLSSSIEGNVNFILILSFFSSFIFFSLFWFLVINNPFDDIVVNSFGFSISIAFFLLPLLLDGVGGINVALLVLIIIVSLALL